MYSARGNDEYWKRRESGKEQDEEEGEGEEVDQLLSSYHKSNSPKNHSSSVRRIDLVDSSSSSPAGATAGSTTNVDEEVVVVSIEHYERPEIESVQRPSLAVEYCSGSPGDNWLLHQNGSSSTSLLRDLLPHLTESNTNVSTPCKAGTNTILSKTYTEPTSLSGLLRQMSSRLFSHYPSKMVIRHSKISPTSSMHGKMDECEDNGPTLDTTTNDDGTPPVIDFTSLENGGGENDVSSAASCSPSSMPTAAPADTASPEDQRKQQRQRRPLMKTPLCKRCPHCRKSCSLRRMSALETRTAYPDETRSLQKGICACRICMVLESVESTLSSPSSNECTAARSGGMIHQMPDCSTSTFDQSIFSSEEQPYGTGSQEGLLGPRRVSLGSLELGMFCGECNRSGGGGGGRRLQESLQPNMNEISYCEQTVPEQKSREQGIQVNSSSMISIATASSFGGPVCRICHSPGDKLEPLISPCRCLGTLKFVHASCLLHWLDISSRKLRRPPHCELCGYRYQRHKTMKFRRIQWPTCSRRDKLYHVLFLISVLMMAACAAVTIVCFKSDRGQPRIPDDTGVLKKATGGAAATVGAGGGGNNQVELSGQEVVTLVCGILFFCAFFVAMYVQVKAQTTVYKLCVRFWTMNQEWHVDEYRRERDAEYWRQRQEQQLQQQRRTSVQLSSNANAAGGPSVPEVLRQERYRPSFSLSQSSSTSFRADMLSGID